MSLGVGVGDGLAPAPKTLSPIGSGVGKGLAYVPRSAPVMYFVQISAGKDAPWIDSCPPTPYIFWNFWTLALSLTRHMPIDVDSCGV